KERKKIKKEEMNKKRKDKKKEKKERSRRQRQMRIRDRLKAIGMDQPKGHKGWGIEKFIHQSIHRFMIQ
ncbi:hypothetical protein DV965_17935, partial [Staphylococcus pseudintermedius]|uniref:hypothetical protein n=1 Tax=Staphylococcus pseudintermedius TaxID=283734 RepID=UPI000E378DCA